MPAAVTIIDDQIRGVYAMHLDGEKISEIPDSCRCLQHEHAPAEASAPRFAPSARDLIGGAA